MSTQTEKESRKTNIKIVKEITRDHAENRTPAVRFVIYTRGLHLSGLTSGCGSSHTCNGRRCGQIEAVNATVLPRGALKKFHACVRLSTKRRNRRCILNPTQSFILSNNRMKAQNRAPHPYASQSCEYFAPRLFSLSFDVCSFVGEALSPPS